MFSTHHSSNGLNTKVEEDEELISQKAIEIARGIELQMAMKSAIELGILDTISEANKDGAYISASEVAAKIPGCVNPNAPAFVDCMLSLLASFSVLKCEFRSKINGEQGEEKVYGVAPICKSHLSDAIREGGTSFEKAHGMKLFEYAQKDARLSRVFNEAMSDYTLIIMKKILQVYKGLEGINVLVDVGGGTAASLMLITSKYPNIRGINFDLPHVVADAPDYPGVEHVGGDMFQEVPNGDALFLKWILHNWSDVDCVRVLKKCWNAIPSKGKVIVMEELLPLVPENNLESQVTLATNLVMYSTFGATERTIEDYKALAMESGFSDCRPICSAHSNWIIEFLKD
ncbi:hypothetical protein V2J09_000087 [Rumex salicifolius]